MKDAGVLAASAHLAPGSKCRRFEFIIADCEFDVIYTTSEGVSRQKHLNITSVFKSINDKLPLEIRYDPADPERISTNWGASLLIYRILGRTLFQVILMGIVIAGVVRAVRMPARIKDLKAAGRNPTPVAVKFIKAVTIRGRLNVHYLWQDPKTGQPRQGWTNFGAYLEPLWLNTEKRIMLGLLSPAGKVYLLDADLSLTDLTQAEKDKVMKMFNLS